MKQIRFYLLLLLTGAVMSVAQPCFSQSLSNTGNVITLTGTCLNGTLSTATYTLTLYYIDPDNGGTHPAAVSVSVVVSGSTATITLPSSTLPIPATDGYWSLPDADQGSLSLTGGPGGGLIDWYHDGNGNIQFNCTPLPIYFSNFTGVQSGTHINLSWQTQLESNTSVIEIYRSTAGSGYYKIGQVNAAGNSSITLSYSFTDVNPGSGTNLYYLKMLSSVGLQAIFSTTIAVGCSGCSYTPPAAVACSYTINGPDHICNLEQLTAYNLSVAVPNYNTITWSIDQPSAAHLATYPAYDRSKVTLLKKNTAAGVYLRATLSGCTNPISKYIAMGTPAGGISTSLSCPELYGSALNAPGATNFEWHLVDLTTYTETITNTTSASYNGYIGGGDTWNIGYAYTNACGTSEPAVNYGFVCGGSGGNPHAIKLSPNPTTGPVAISLATAPAPEITNAAVQAAGAERGVITHKFITAGYAAPGSPEESARSGMTAASENARAVVDPKAPGVVLSKPVPPARVYEIRILDKMGVLKRTFTYPGGVENSTVDLSGLPADIYTVRVFDNVTWTARQIILTK